MTGNEAVTLLIERFPVLTKRVEDPSELFETPHVSFSLLAAEVLENDHDPVLIRELCQFIDDLASSGDEQLEEFLVVDVLEGIAQDTNLTARVRSRVSAKAIAFLERVEKEFYGRHR